MAGSELKEGKIMKDKLLDQSIQLFQKKGYSETSIQDIVDALGVTKGTFYYYFDSKEKLLMDIHRLYIDDLLFKQQEILEHPSKSYKEKLYENVYILLNEIGTKGDMAKISFRELINLNKDNSKVIVEKREQFRRNVQKVIQMGMETGEFRKDVNAHFVTLAILGMCNWSFFWFNPSGPYSEKELIDTYIGLILNGIYCEPE